MKQSAWQKNKETDITKIQKAIDELAGVDIEHEINQHALLKTYDDHAAKIKSLNKERATLETALMQADKTVKKYEKEIAKLADNKCPACEQDLHDHKHEEMIKSAEKNLLCLLYTSDAADE